MKIKVGIIGATGYGGLEIARILLSHPEVEIVAISSVSFEGKIISNIYPAMLGLLDIVLVNENEVIEKSDVIFAALPHGLSENIASTCNKANKIFIDLGADFRLCDEDEYKTWYGCEFLDSILHKSAVYGLPELFRDKIKSAKLIANPGCYPTSIALGLAPLVTKDMLELNSIIIDAKSGATGAGRALSQTTHYTDCNEGFLPYKVAEHRHTPEIEQTLEMLSNKPVTITFVPHLLPVNRGILSTIYANPVENIGIDELHALYTDFYKNEKFVRIMPKGTAVNIKHVQYSNYCDISLHVDKRTNRVIIASTIDNMIKGAAGQAIQNMNIICGFAEDTALNLVPPSF